MFKFLKTAATTGRAAKIALNTLSQQRTFLSHAYYCNEVWDRRLQDPIFKGINLEELYSELDQRYQKTRNISAVDVDIFVNAVKDDTYADEMLDLLHKLRMSADTCNTLNSTSHAVIRNLSNFEKTNQLLSVLDDRLNYGLFLDDFTANVLMDKFWKAKDYLSGARTATQLMLQEDFHHPLCTSLSLLHCYHYLLQPTEWPQPPKPEEPEEEIKIRIRYLRNPYDDDHFDLKDPMKLIGKTLMMATNKLQNSLEKSLYLLGVVLYGKQEDADILINKLSQNNESIYEDILKQIPKEHPLKSKIESLKLESADISQMLEDNVKSVLNSVTEKDVALQCENYLKWEEERKQALNRQRKRLLTIKRLEYIEETQKQLKERETLLWYFENEEKIELEIEKRKAILEEHAKKHHGGPKTKADETYIPPEVAKKYNQ